MSAVGIVVEEIDKQAALAGAAIRNVAGISATPEAKHLLPGAVLDMVAPYSAALFFAERVLQCRFAGWKPAAWWCWNPCWTLKLTI